MTVARSTKRESTLQLFILFREYANFSAGVIFLKSGDDIDTEALEPA